MFQSHACRALAGVLLAAHAAFAQAAFKDPLSTPALPTTRLADAPMTAVVRTGAGRLVAGGWRGLIALSDDDGKTWRQAEVPVREDLTALSFPTPTHGWAVGNEGVLLETTDAGAHWAKRLDGNVAARLMVDTYTAAAAAHPDDAALAGALKEARSYQAQAPSRPLLDVAFEDERVGYVAGTYGMLFRTVDAGRTWTPWLERADNPDGYNIYAIHVAGGQVFLAGELGLALKLDRAQERFVKLAPGYEGSFFALAGESPALIAAGLRGNALRSADDGRSWQKVDFHAAAPTTFSGAALMPDGAVVLVTLSGQLFLSADHGRSFTAVATRSPMRYSAVAPAGAHRVVVVGSQGIRIESTPDSSGESR
jgi:photosystem II stability/assembly factor-like uncharacterized protein